jgi:galactoside O-acetyltransferase
VFRAIGNQARAFAEATVNVLPGAIGYVVRRCYFGSRLGRLGSAAVIGEGFLVNGARNVIIGERFSCWRLCTIAACDDGRIEIGARVSLNANVYINACRGGRVQIGDDVLIGPNVVIRSSDHQFGDVTTPIRAQGHSGGTIAIEDDVWIGANVTLVSGASVGRGSVIAAGAVVTGRIEPFAVAGGVPARLLKMRGGHISAQG